MAQPGRTRARSRKTSSDDGQTPGVETPETAAIEDAVVVDAAPENDTAENQPPENEPPENDRRVDGDEMPLAEVTAIEDAPMIAAAPPVRNDAPAPPSNASPEPPAAPPAPPKAPPAARAPIGGMVFGGAIAAVLGAGVALALFPQGWNPVDTRGMEARLAAIEGRTGLDRAALDAALGAALEGGLSPLDQRLAALESLDITGLTNRLAALEGAAPVAVAPVDLTPLEQRLSALETATPPAPDLGPALAPLESRLARIETDLGDAARAAVDSALAAARTEVQRQAGDVAVAQASVAAQAALAELVAAAETGAPAPAALAQLAEAGPTPEALAPFADGIATLAELQAAFAPAARAALAAEPPPPDAPLVDRLMNFLRSQTGARSLAPRAGDDADAVLSRSEALLRQGDLRGALAESLLLQGPAAEAMLVWQAKVETRLAAMDALADLQSSLTNPGE